MNSGHNLATTMAPMRRLTTGGTLRPDFNEGVHVYLAVLEDGASHQPHPGPPDTVDPSMDRSLNSDSTEPTSPQDRHPFLPNRDNR